MTDKGKIVFENGSEHSIGRGDINTRLRIIGKLLYDRLENYRTAACMLPTDTCDPQAVIDLFQDCQNSVAEIISAMMEDEA